MSLAEKFENFSKVKYDDLDIDWSRVAEPQEDSYDITAINQVANLLFDYEKPVWEEGTKFLLDDAVAIRYQSGHHGGDIIVVGEDDEEVKYMDGIDHYFKTVSPKYYQSIKGLLDFYVPMYDKASGTQAGLGCTCGPVTKAAEPGSGLDKGCVGVTSTINTHTGAVDGIIHETFHQRLYQLGVEMEESNLQLISNDPEELYNSPIRFDIMRPMTACVQAIYSYVCVSEYYLDMIKYALGTENDEFNHIDRYGLQSIMHTCAYNIFRISNGRILMNRSLEHNTAAGKAFFDAFGLFMDRVIDSGIEVMKPYKEEMNLQYEPTFK